ncbi:hypothetical protein Trydic_g16484 [Trypoxylus dichotomus]
MDEEIDDIKKLDAIIMEEHDHNTFRDEFDDFIDHPISDDEQLEGVDEEELTEIEGVVDNIVNKLDNNIYHNVENLNFSADLNLRYKIEETINFKSWTVEDQVILRRAIIFNYNTYSIDKLESNLKVLEASKKVSSSVETVNDVEAKVLSIKEKLVDLKTNSDHVPPPLDTDVEIDWLNISKCDLDNRHLPEACKAFWNIYLHPSINKEDWTEAENKQIVNLAKKYNFQNWEQIAKELNNNRSGFVVCVHYNTSLSERIRRDKFDPEEDRCSKYIPHRAPTQLAHRYINYLAFDHIDLGSYTLEDDEIIMDHAKHYGEKGWSKLFTIFRRKNRTHLRQRYFYLKKWLATHPEKKLKDLPRKSRYKRTLDNRWAVSSCIDHFSTSPELPSLYEINDYLRKLDTKSISLIRHQPVTYHPPSANIDKKLIEYFQSTCKIRTSKMISGSELNHIVDIIKSLMAVLDVEFVVPNVELLHENQNLDILDVEILTLLFSDVSSRENKCILPSTSIKTSSTPLVQTLDFEGHEKQLLKFYQPDVISYLPPNINSLVGIRSLLLLHQSYKSKYTTKKQVTNLNIKAEAIDSLDEVQNVVTDKERFYTRFNSIFKWSAVMSIVKPKETLFVNKSVKKVGPSIVEPPKVGRPKKNLIKIELMNRARMKNKKLSSAKAPKVGQSKKKPASNMPQTTEVSENTIHTSTNQSIIQGNKSVASVKPSDTVKRSVDDEIESVCSKKIKTEASNGNNELTQLRGDIDKLDNVLRMEMNKPVTVVERSDILL